MKILFHISSLFGGGAERVMSYLINHNCELNNEVYIVVCYEKVSIIFHLKQKKL